MQFKPIGKIPESGRVLHAAFPTGVEDILQTKQYPSKYFGLLFSWPFDPLVPNEVLAVGEHFVQSGAVYISAWDKNCELVHDIFDEAILGLRPEYTGDRAILTTWLKDKPLDKVMWDFINVSFPNKAFEEECGSAVMVFLNQTEEKVIETIHKKRLLG